MVLFLLMIPNAYVLDFLDMKAFLLALTPLLFAHWAEK